MLKLDQLRCFLVAVRTGSFVDAGRQLNLSASAIAYKIKMLEDRLGMGLLIRKPASGVSATREGLRLLEMTEPLLAELAEIEEMFDGRGKRLRGELVVGCQEALSWTLIPLAIQRLTTKHPELKVSQKVVFLAQGNDPVVSGDVDVLLTFTPIAVEEAGINNEVLCEPFLCAMMSSDHPLAKKREGVSLAELARFRQVFTVDGPAFDFYMSLYRDESLSPDFTTVSNINTGAQAMIGLDDSVSLRFVRPAHDLSPLGHRLAFPRVTDCSRHASVMATSAKRHYGRSQPKVEAFIQECRMLFEDGTMRRHMLY